MSSSLLKLICCGPQDLYTRDALEKLNNFFKATEEHKDQFVEQRKHLTHLFNRIAGAYITSGLIEEEEEKEEEAEDGKTDEHSFPSVLDKFDRTYNEYIQKYHLPDLYMISFFKILYPRHDEISKTT